MAFTTKILRVLGCLMLLSYGAAAHSQVFVEGQHYSVLKSPIKAESYELTEFFSFSCPGCYAIEPSLERLVENKPGLTLRRVHAPFGGRNAKHAQKAFVLMVLLGEERNKQVIFDRIHLKRDSFDSDLEVVRYFKELGYAESDVASSLRSFSADAMIRKMNKEVINNQITSVPTLIWAGKYQINLQALAGQSALTELLGYLSSLD
ncbi:thiol:disulfide interchange protein [Arenicella chitinivorans]|uniref:Thiol:disulfide interchange protein n=1 Tax=Arenicella chitinivorans TaxID=1329800 RepID=A0A918RJC1_9GAMM|nr:thiol:disulfide interchange protein DsbA/DsbL [Arenicella chitinivorans]GHA01038.1 thiol:disulfide interchange protein [Arenicella chitinivorans]